MLYSIINECDIFYTEAKCNNQIRSSNPYDYIRKGYYLDNAALFGGYDNVDYNSNFSGNRTSN